MAESKETSFVSWVLANQKEGNKGLMAQLRKAESETTEYQSWELLTRWIDIEKQWERNAYGLIGASLSRVKTGQDGNLSIGGALRALAFQKEKTLQDLGKSSEALRLRRLLACKDQDELINILRPLLRYLTTNEIGLSHKRLLKEVLWFGIEQSQERSKTRWVKDFYFYTPQEEQP